MNESVLSRFDRCRSFLEGMPWDFRFRKRSFDQAFQRWVSEASVWSELPGASELPVIQFEIACPESPEYSRWLATLGCILAQTWPRVIWSIAGCASEPFRSEREAMGLSPPILDNDCAEERGQVWRIGVSSGDLLHPSLAGRVAMAAMDGARAVAWDFNVHKVDADSLIPIRRVRGWGCDPLADVVLDRRQRAFALPCQDWLRTDGCTTAERRLLTAPFPDQWRVLVEPLSSFEEFSNDAPQPHIPGVSLLSRIWGVEFNENLEGRNALPSRQPNGISVVILFRDRHDLTARALQSIASQSCLSRVEVVLVDNQSRPDTLQRLRATVDQLRLGDRTKWVGYPHAFNHSRQCLIGASAGTGEVIVFLNNDAAFLDADGLERLARWALVPNVASVGAGLENEQGQACGGGFLARAQPGAEFNSPVEEQRFATSRLTVGNTFACVAVSRLVFNSIGGLDPIAFPIGFNDVDYCLRAVASGWRHVNLPDVRVTHAVGATRAGQDEVAQKLELRRRHPWVSIAGLHEPMEEALPGPVRLTRKLVKPFHAIQGSV